MQFFLFKIFCLVIFEQFVESLVTEKDYARLPPIFEFDNFDRCMNLEDEALYCFVEFKIRPADPSNVSKLWTDIQELNTSPRNYEHDRLRHGICVPFQCPEIKVEHTDEKFTELFERCLSNYYENVGFNTSIEEMSCQTSTSKPFDLFDFLAIALLLAYVVFVIYASIYEGLARYKSPEEYRKLTGSSSGKFLKCFSISNNWLRMTRSDDSPDARALKAVQGIRVYTLILIIWAHATGSTLQFNTNTKFLEKAFDSFATVLLSSGIYCLSFFFLVSAWMLSYRIFKTFDKNSGRELDIKTIMIITINRYLRITIPLLVCLLVQISIIPHISSGPLWDVVIGEERQRCRKNMWTNLLYINNLVNTSEMCFFESWYLAVDMQGFILGIILLYYLVKKPERIWWLLPSVLVINQAILARRLYIKKVYNPVLIYPENVYKMRGMYNEDGEFINYTGNSNSHFTTTLFGIFTGYIFYKYGNKGLIAQRVASSKIAAIGWWVCSFGLGLSISILPGLWILSKYYQPSFWFSIPYLIGSPIIFSIALSVGYLGHTEGVGGFTYWAAVWTPINALGKLTYSTYLAHYLVSVTKVGRINSVRHADEWAAIGETIDIAACSLLLGLILTLFTELPLSALQKIYLENKVQKETNETHQNEKSS